VRTNNLPQLREPLLVDVKEAARLLGVSDRTVWSVTAPRGTLPCVRVGGRVLYSPDTLREWVRSQQGPGPDVIKLA
jgi:excisionase family DNA binding protein